MLALASQLVILTISLITVRVATIALTLTGLSRESARFQARSAFTGTGFTTRESESVVEHPVRRRVVMALMLLRSAGIVSAVSSLLLGFVDVDDSSEGWTRVAFVAVGLLLLWWAMTSRPLDRLIRRGVYWGLRRLGHADVRDYAALLHLAGDYAVGELRVREDDWLVDRPLERLDLPGEGVLVLGVQRYKGPYLGIPKGSTELGAGDTVILYGRQSQLHRLERRRRDTRGGLEHLQGVIDQQQAEAAEEDRVPVGG